MESQAILQSLFKVLFPEVIAMHFEITSVNELNERIEIRMEELAELVPPGLESCTNISLDGFCNPLELQSFPLKGKPVFIKLYRRRWKQKGTDQHFSNTYDIHPEGVKATKDFAAFLKEAFGQSPDQYNDNLKELVR